MFRRLLTKETTLLLTLAASNALAQAPVVVSRSPARYAPAAPRATNVALTFSQPIDAATASAVKVHAYHAGGRKAGTFATAGPTVTFDPTTDFKAGEKVEVTVPATLRSTAGAAATPQVHQFTTATGGTGRGNFLPGATVFAEMLCHGLAMGDVDNDGDLDIATASHYNSSVRIRLNGGNASGSNTGVFTTGQTLSFAMNPRSVLLADVDGDGDLDLLNANQASNDVDITLNGGDNTGANVGTFSRGTFVDVGNEPWAIAAGDVDGDGDLDLLTANSSALTVSVRFNNGLGIFSGTQNVPVGGRPQSLALADVDNDGDLDFLAGYASTASSVSVRLNNGSGIFSGTQNVAVAGSCNGVAVGDVDGDGDVDLVSSAGTAVSVRLNGGDASGSATGIFSAGQNLPGMGAAFAIALADVDADGDLDIVVTDVSGTGAVNVRLNGGDASGSNTGVFGGGGSLAVGSQPYSLALGDLDGDGDLDFITNNFNSGNGSLSVRFNQPPPPVVTALAPTTAVAGTTVTVTGTNLLGATVRVNGLTVTPTANTGTSFSFVVPTGATPTGNMVVTTPGGSSSTPFTIGLAVVSTIPGANYSNVSRPSSSVHIFMSEPVTTSSANSLGVFSARAGGRKIGSTPFASTLIPFLATTGPTAEFRPGEEISVTVPPAIQSYGGISARKRVFRFTTATGGTGRGNFHTGPDVAVAAQPYGVTTADVDGDGDQDLIAAATGPSGQGNIVSIRLNDGTGAFGPGADLPVASGASGGVDVTAADVDGDGDLDLLTANAQTNNVSVLLNIGNGTFINGANVAVSGAPRRVTTADVDGDGDLDLLTANYSGGAGSTVSVRLNNGYGLFTGGPDVPVGAGVLALTTADVDGDGDLDLLTANAGPNGNGSTASVCLNDGNGSFGLAQAVTVGAGPASVAAADVDGDGDLDLLTANAGSNWTGSTVSIRLNDGTGTFSGGSDPSVGTGPSQLATADVDADGDLDLLTVNAMTNNVSVRLNNGSGTFAGGSDPLVDTSTFNGAGAQGLTLADVDGDGDLDLLTANSGNPTSSTVSVRLNQVPGPTVLSLSPATGPVGTTVVIGGTNLGGTTAVAFNGTAATFTIDSPTQLTATVPAGASTGLVRVTAASGVANSPLPFTVTVPFAVVTVPRNQSNVSATGPVAVTFGTPVSNAPTSLGALSVFSQQAGGRKAGAATATANTLAFVPATGFRAGETVMVTLTNAVQNTAGTALSQGQTFQFTTATSSTGPLGPGRSTVAVGTGPTAVVTADVNGDNLLDLLSANTQGNTISIRLGTSVAGTYSGTTNMAFPAPVALGTADLDNDGDLDLYVSSGTSAQPLQVGLNNGSGTAFTFAPVAVAAGSAGSRLAVTAADVDADGYLDLLAASAADGAVSVRLNDHTGHFIGTGSFNLNTAGGTLAPTCLGIADVDNDGDWDLLTGNLNPNSLSIRLNNGSGVFSGGTDLPLPAEPHSLRSADLNNDQLLDLVIRYANTSALQVLTGTSAGSFALRPLLPGTASDLALGDLDGDGDTDLVSADNAAASATVLTNDGTGSFLATATVPLGTAPGSLALADLDGDADLDLVAGNPAANTLTVLLQQRPTATQGGSLTPLVNVFPNPARGRFYLQLPAAGRELTLTVFDALGRAVLTQRLALPGTAATVEASVARLPAGSYTVQGVMAGQSFVKKLLLE